MKQKQEQKISVLFMLYGILFCVCLITANVLETKQISFGPRGMGVWSYATAHLARFRDELHVCDIRCDSRLDSRGSLLAW